MVRILVPMDGSESALRALDHALERLTQSGDGEIHLLAVQTSIPASVGDFVGGDAVRRYQQEEGEKALGEGKRRLATAEVRHVAEIRVGRVAEEISEYATGAGCDEIVMGSRGLGSLSGLVLGSVATRVLHLAPVPVTIVK